MFQQPVLFLWRDALSNVLLPAQIEGLDAAQSKRRALELLDQVGL